MSMATPLPATIRISVAMIGWTPMVPTRSPLPNPKKMETARATSSASSKGQPLCTTKTAATAPEIAITDPTETFTPTELFFEPGFNAIDSTLLPRDGKVYMFFKDETKHPSPKKNILLAVADDMAGPYEVKSEPVTPPGTWVEGPSAVEIDDYVYLYFDAYTEHHYSALRSRDLRNWENMTSKLSMPEGIRHGTAFAVSGEIVRGLLEKDREAHAPGTLINPLIPQRADPHIFLHTDGHYYLTATVPEYDRIELRRARTLVDLATADPKTIWRRHESGPMSHHIWAPEIHFIDGKWYIHLAAGRAEAIWHIRMYVLENDSPNPLEGAWVEKGQIQTDWDSFSLDATTFEHSGERYLAWAQNPPETRGTSVYLAKMDTPWSIASPQMMITRPEFDWERIGHNVNEGPSVIHRNGRLFMTYSASATDHNYCIGLLTADEDADLLDPASWSKSSEPVFRSSVATNQFGPGHNSFTTSPDGRIDYIVYHARGYKDIRGEPLHNPDRATRVQVLDWNTDGTPKFGVPVSDGPLSR